MLRRSCLAMSMGLALAVAMIRTQDSHADQCSTQFDGGYDGIAIGVTCGTAPNRTDDTSPEAAGGDSADAIPAQEPPGCFEADGTEVPCWVGSQWWEPSVGMYCQKWDAPSDSSYWEGHRDESGNPTGYFYLCRTYGHEATTEAPVWFPSAPTTPENPDSAAVDPATVVKQAVADLGLHAPTVGVGAYVYPDARDWDLSWWVGAPLWLWIDPTDSLQWGTHTISASEGGVTISATVTASALSFDPGDGSAAVTCATTGTPRPWNPDDLLSHHSPSGCEHTYMTTNTLGDKSSRFTVSATVSWSVEWSTTDGQSGGFALDLDSTDNPAIHVGEVHSVLVANPDQ